MTCHGFGQGNVAVAGNAAAAGLWMTCRSSTMGLVLT